MPFRSGQTLSFIDLIVRVQIPDLVRIGIDRALVERTADLTRYVWLIAGPGSPRY